MQHKQYTWQHLDLDVFFFVNESGEIYIEVQHVIINLLHLSGTTPIEIHLQFSEICRHNVMDMKNVCVG